MGEPKFEITEEYVLKITHVSGRMYHQEVMMDKQTFVEAYKKWILEDAKNAEIESK